MLGQKQGSAGLCASGSAASRVDEVPQSATLSEVEALMHCQLREPPPGGSAEVFGDIAAEPLKTHCERCNPPAP